MLTLSCDTSVHFTDRFAKNNIILSSYTHFIELIERSTRFQNSWNVLYDFTNKFDDSHLTCNGLIHFSLLKSIQRYSNVDFYCFQSRFFVRSTDDMYVFSVYIRKS